MPKPVVVFLCQRLPYPPIKGERITSFNLLRYLARHYRVFVGTFIDDPADKVEIGKLQSMVEELHFDEISKPWSFLHAFPRWIMGEPVSFALFRSRTLGLWLDRIETEYKPVAIITHSSNISAYAVDKFRRGEGQDPKRILHFADVDSEKFAAYAECAAWGPRKWLYQIEARRVRREELRLARGADAVAFVSKEEAALFQSLLPEPCERVVTLPNGVDIETFDPGRYPYSPFDGQGAALVFTGAMDYLPNIDAVTWFAREVFPTIQQAIPHAQLLIVGSKPTPEVKRLALNNTGVIVTGRVESVAAYLAHAQVAIAPLQIARGIQNKVLEAMAMAMPIVVSKGALTGISAVPGKHLICAETPAQWADACLTLMQDPDRAKEMGRAARTLVQDVYTWDAQFAILEKLLAQGNAVGLPAQVGA